MLILTPSRISPSLQVIISLSIFLLLSSFFTSCTSTTKPKTGSLSGHVTLVNDTGEQTLDPVDFSGASVAIYNLVVLDTTLVRINGEYPQIGMQISQETEFDHRQQSPVATVTTDAAGHFQFAKIGVGTYNLVVKKAGWSLKYICNINIEPGENDLAITQFSDYDIKEIDNSVRNMFKRSISDIVLYPMISLGNVVQDDQVFKSDHTYLITDNLTILSHVTIEGGAVVLVNPGCRVDFHSGFTSVNGSRLWWISSSYSMYGDLGIPNDPEDRFERISFSENAQVSISNGKISYIQDGLTFNSIGSTLLNLVCRDGGTSVIANGSDFSLSNCIFRDFSDRSINIFGESRVTKNVFFKNHDNLIITDTACEVDNNYFADNWLGIRPIYGTITIHNNEFVRNRWAISTVASSPLIQFNNFFDSTRYCIQTQLNYVQNSSDYSNPIISSNNFFKDQGFVVSLLPDGHDGYYMSSYVGVNSDIDATQNYWKASDASSVILDTNDDDEIYYKVNYIPRKYSRVLSAGINIR